MTSTHDGVANSAPSPASSGAAVPKKTGDMSEKHTETSHVEGGAKQEDEYSDLKYPEPWKYEKWFLGGYGQKWMLKFKKPKTMYYAINLFAGTPVTILNNVAKC